MNEKSLQNIEESMNDCKDRAWACSSDSEDFLKLLKQQTECAKILNENQKMRNELYLEMQRIELEKERLKAQSSWLDPKIWVPVVASIGTTIISFVCQRSILREHRRETMTFEKDGIWTTQAGKANQNAFKLIRF